MPTEWYFNETSHLLYLWPNNTNNTNHSQTNMNEPPSNHTILIATNLKILFNFNASIDNPIKNINIFNLNFRDTAYTFLDKQMWGTPSGGMCCMCHLCLCVCACICVSYLYLSF